MLMLTEMGRVGSASNTTEPFERGKATSVMPGFQNRPQPVQRVFLLGRQGAIASCRISGEPKTERIRALTNRLSTRSLFEGEQVPPAYSVGSQEGKRRFYV